MSSTRQIQPNSSPGNQGSLQPNLGVGQNKKSILMDQAASTQVRKEKKKRQIAWKEQFETIEVENWKEYNTLGDDGDNTGCRCSLI